ncbi:hypothetical protein [Hoeflea sp.]|uniref:hypothetical protein n=1 Tax=Hoeflea sp. TaxID=1940281 RepID=UPI00374835E2
MKNKIIFSKCLMKIGRYFAFFSIAIYFLVYNNYLYIYYNKDLYKAFLKGSYENFQSVGKDDALYSAVENYINIENIKGEKSVRLDIAINVFFFIQTAQYVEVYFALDNCVDCIKLVVYRNLPG